MASMRKRWRKLNSKTALSVLREDEIDPNDYESLTTETQIATGVEQAEEQVRVFGGHVTRHVTFAAV